MLKNYLLTWIPVRDVTNLLINYRAYNRLPTVTGIREFMDVLGCIQTFDPGSVSKLVFSYFNLSVTKTIAPSKFILVFHTKADFERVAPYDVLLLTPNTSGEICIYNSGFPLIVYFNGGSSITTGGGPNRYHPFAYCPV